MASNLFVKGLSASLMLVLLTVEGESLLTLPLVKAAAPLAIASKHGGGYGGGYGGYGGQGGKGGRGYYQMPLPPPPRQNSWGGMSRYNNNNNVMMQCNAQWKNALLSEALNYNNWKCATKTAADGSTQACVLTGPVPTGAVQTIVTGCGWIMPVFCDDMVNDVVTSLLASTPTVAPAVPVGYTLAAGVAYYKVHPELKTWAEAKTICESEGVGTHLATPTTANDYTTLLNVLNAAIPAQAGAWIGITDAASEGNWVSVNGQPGCMLGLRFNPAQPDGGTAENCPQFGVANLGGSNDFSCANALPFICEQTFVSRLAPCRA